MVKTLGLQIVNIPIVKNICSLCQFGSGRLILNKFCFTYQCLMEHRPSMTLCHHTLFWDVLAIPVGPLLLDLAQSLISSTFPWQYLLGH